MRVLWLTNSSDAHPGVPPAQRSQAVAARLIEEALGEPVETLQKGVWPTAGLSTAADRWVRDFQPDVVFLRLSSYPVAYESIPLRLQRKLGRAGNSVANAGGRVGNSQWLAERRVYQVTRTAVTRVIGGDTHFTPSEVVARLEETFRGVIARETIVPVVRGTSLLLNTSGTKKGLRRSKRRVTELNALTQAMCERLQIAFFPELSAEETSSSRLGDLLHDDACAHEKLGQDDALAILAAWRAAAPAMQDLSTAQG